MRINLLILGLTFLLGGCFTKKWKQKPYSQNFNPLMEVHHEELVV